MSEEMSEEIAGMKIDILALENKLKKITASEVKIIHQDTKYRIVIERAASTKGVDGFKVESNGDVLDIVTLDAWNLYYRAKELTSPDNSGNATKKELTSPANGGSITENK